MACPPTPNHTHMGHSILQLLKSSNATEGQIPPASRGGMPPSFTVSQDINNDYDDAVLGDEAPPATLHRQFQDGINDISAHIRLLQKLWAQGVACGRSEVAREINVESLPQCWLRDWLEDIAANDPGMDLSSWAQFVHKRAEQEGDLAAAYVEHLCCMVYGSSTISNAGVSWETTCEWCKGVFDGQDVDSSHITFEGGVTYRASESSLARKPAKEFEEEVEEVHGKNLQEELGEKLNKWQSLSSASGDVRREVIQHAKAAKHILHQVAILGEGVTEELILGTHRILTYGLYCEHMTWSQHAGIYRTTNTAGFPDPSEVPRLVRQLVNDLNTDIHQALEDCALDPTALAAKYCHKFVCVQPFVVGSGRLGRLILNALLLRYTGLIVCFGEDDQDKQQYLKLMSNGSEAGMADHGKPDKDTDKNDWKGLSSFILGHALISVSKVKAALKTYNYPEGPHPVEQTQIAQPQLVPAPTTKQPELGPRTDAVPEPAFTKFIELLLTLRLSQPELLPQIVHVLETTARQPGLLSQTEPVPITTVTQPEPLRQIAVAQSESAPQTIPATPRLLPRTHFTQTNLVPESDISPLYLGSPRSLSDVFIGICLRTPRGQPWTLADIEEMLGP